jgi:FkbM family methyltransferase
MNPSDGLQKLKKYFSDDEINCLDIGANIGQFFHKFKDSFPHAYIHMIEANPHCEKHLTKLSSTYEIVGLSDKEGTLKFYTSATRPRAKGASFYPEHTFKNLDEKDILILSVPVRTLDSYSFDRKFDLVKIDVQGSELDIIKGGTKFLQDVDFVLVEVSLTEYNQGAPLADEVIKKLEELDFYIVDVVDEHKNKKEEILQLDLLFSKINKEHDCNIIKKYNLLSSR